VSESQTNVAVSRDEAVALTEMKEEALTKGLGQEIALQPSEPIRKGAFTVLVVDDDQLVLELLQEYLKDEEYQVITAGSGEEGISKIHSVRVDIALVDYKMPGMDGLETIEKMTESDPETVTILMTGFPTIDSSIKAMKLGASNYILKPFKLEEVKLAVTKATQEHQLRQEMKNLRKRVSEFEKGITEKKESIKFNQKLNIVSTPEGYSARIKAYEAESHRHEPAEPSESSEPDLDRPEEIG
jgi:YesN/AraC family two-component response regulator